MDPQKQRQMINTVYENTAKTQEELQNMDAEERRAYLKGRLKQRMFFTGASRQSTHQKKVMQERMQQKAEEEQVKQELEKKKKAEKNKKKREKRKAKKREQKVEEVTREEEEEVLVEKESESDYESDIE